MQLLAGMQLLGVLSLLCMGYCLVDDCPCGTDLGLELCALDTLCPCALVLGLAGRGPLVALVALALSAFVPLVELFLLSSSSLSLSVFLPRL